MTIFVRYHEERRQLKFSCLHERSERDFLLKNLDNRDIAYELSGWDVWVSVDAFQGVDDIEATALHDFQYALESNTLELNYRNGTFLYSMEDPSDFQNLYEELYESLDSERAGVDNGFEEFKYADNYMDHLLIKIINLRDAGKEQLEKYYEQFKPIMQM